MQVGRQERIHRQALEFSRDLVEGFKFMMFYGEKVEIRAPARVLASTYPILCCKPKPFPNLISPGPI
ncbi:hypothetical protein CHS0354_012261 [Potamilus streckersoni]|uniref:Uncharacterized protein n=1 Tax=Potamilus streckersoni TaxID=2493646 RepID=A0AAE0SAK8_9BIVA|nr:hypothetical protein CHS0354_012261 [Potamilus streckersoni]